MSEKKRVLVVDDSRINVKAISEALKYEYKIMAATSGEQALRAVRSDHPPDIVLLDIMMPGVDGFEVCRRMKSHPKSRHIPVIFITSRDDYADEARGLSVGAVDYITKPIVPAIVRARVKTQIQLRNHMDELEQANATIHAQKERMEHELQVGRKLQQSMLPELPEGDARFSIAGSMRSAFELSGDFYDAFFVDQHHLCICIGDVSGKGVPAALFMNMSRTLVRIQADADLSTARIVTRVNERIAEKNDPCMFVTLFVGMLDVRTGAIIYTNAGHTPPLIRRGGGDVERLMGRHGPAVGVDQVVYGEEIVELMDGDTLLLYTDGVTEARGADGDLFGEDRLISLVESADVEDVSGLVSLTGDRIGEFESGRDQSDDVTLLGIEYATRPIEARSGESHGMSLDETDLQEKHLSEHVKEFLSSANLAQDLYETFYLVLDELLSNVVDYGYPAQMSKSIDIALEVNEDEAILHLSDDGISFNPLDVPPPDKDVPLDRREVGGLGIHLCRQLVDDITYERKSFRNHLRLVKKRHFPAKQSEPMVESVAIR